MYIEKHNKYTSRADGSTKLYRPHVGKMAGILLNIDVLLWADLPTRLTYLEVFTGVAILPLCPLYCRHGNQHGNQSNLLFTSYLIIDSWLT